MTTLFYVIYPAALAAPSAAQIVARQDSTGAVATASGNAPLPSGNIDPFDLVQASGLVVNRRYRIAYVTSYDGSPGFPTIYSDVVVSEPFFTTGGAELISSLPVVWANNVANPVGQTIDIPADTTAVYMFWAYWNSPDGVNLSSATLNGVAFNARQENTPAGNQTSTGVVVWYDPPTGNQTLDVEWDSAPGEGPSCIVAFVKGGSTRTWRDAGVFAAEAAATVSTTLVTSPGDLVIKFAQKYNTEKPGLSVGWIDAATQTNPPSGSTAESARLSYIRATGTSQVCDAEPPYAYSSVVAVAIPATVSVGAKNLTSGGSTSNGAGTGAITVPDRGVIYVAVAAAFADGTYAKNCFIGGDLAGKLSGGALTLVQQRTYGIRRSMWVFRGVNNTGSDQTGTILFTLTDPPNTGYQEHFWAVDLFTDVDVGTPNGIAAANFGTAAAGSVTVTGTPDAGDYVYAAFAHTIAGADMTINSELSNELSETGGGINVRRLFTGYDSTPASTPVPGVTWTGSDDWGGIAFIVNAGNGFLFTDEFPSVLDSTQWTQLNNWGGGDVTASAGKAIGANTGSIVTCATVIYNGVVPDNQRAQVTIGDQDWQTPSYRGFVIARCSGDVNINGNQMDYYAADVPQSQQDGDARDCYLVKVVNGVATNLGAAVSLATTNGDTIEIRVHGQATTTVEFWHNGSLAFSRTDSSSPLLSGTFGFGGSSFAPSFARFEGDALLPDAEGATSVGTAVIVEANDGALIFAGATASGVVSVSESTDPFSGVGSTASTGVVSVSESTDTFSGVGLGRAPRLVQSNYFGGPTAATTAVISFVSPVTAGNLVAVWLGWDDQNINPTVSDGTNTYTPGPRQSQNNAYGQWFYNLSAPGGSTTITVNYGASTPLRGVLIHEFVGSGEWVLDAAANNGGVGVSLVSGSVSLSGSNGVVLGAGKHYAGGTYTNGTQTIGGVLANFTSGPLDFRSANWYRTFDTPVSNVTANITRSGSGDWVCNAIAFRLVSDALVATSASTENATDTVAGSVSINSSGDTAVTDNADTTVAVGSSAVAVDVSATETLDAHIGGASSSTVATSASTDNADIVVATGSIARPGLVEITDAMDVPAAVGSVQASVIVELSESLDVGVGVGSGQIVATGSLSDSVDGVVAAGQVSTAGAAAFSDIPDVGSVSGSISSSASVAVNEIPDAATTGSSTLALGVLGAVESLVDTAASLSTVRIAAVVNATETAVDVATIYSFEEEVTLGSAAVVEEFVDTATASGQITLSGAVAATETKDVVLVIAGVAVSVGELTATEVADGGSASAELTLVGTVSAIENLLDSAAATAATGSGGTGTGATVEEIWNYEILPGVPAKVALAAIYTHLLVTGGTNADIAAAVAAHPQTLTPAKLASILATVT